MNNVKAIIFDIYGVLGLNGWQAFKHKHFENRPEAWDALRDIGQQVDAGTMETHELVSAVAKVAGVSEAEVERQLDDTVPNEPLIAFIRTLRPSYKIGVLSNASKPDIAHQIFAEEDLALFDALITSYHVGYTKPDVRMFDAICKQLGVRPEECIFVDDQLRHLEAGQKVCMKTVQYESVQQTIDDVSRLLSND
ncbi:MAG: HAD-IA family hydrolase [Candidatus Saccharimonadales bacterium]